MCSRQVPLILINQHLDLLCGSVVHPMRALSDLGQTPIHKGVTSNLRASTPGGSLPITGPAQLRRSDEQQGGAPIGTVSEDPSFPSSALSAGQAALPRPGTASQPPSRSTQRAEADLEGASSEMPALHDALVQGAVPTTSLSGRASPSQRRPPPSRQAVSITQSAVHKVPVVQPGPLVSVTPPAVTRLPVHIGNKEAPGHSQNENSCATAGSKAASHLGCPGWDDDQPHCNNIGRCLPNLNC